MSPYAKLPRGQARRLWAVEILGTVAVCAIIAAIGRVIPLDL